MVTLYNVNKKMCHSGFLSLHFSTRRLATMQNSSRYIRVFLCKQRKSFATAFMRVSEKRGDTRSICDMGHQGQSRVLRGQLELVKMETLNSFISGLEPEFSGVPYTVHEIILW